MPDPTSQPEKIGVAIPGIKPLPEHIKRYSFEAGFDLAITIDIDTSIYVPEYAQGTATFWASKDEVAVVAKHDLYEILARYAASRLLSHLLDGYNEEGAVAELHTEEGWCIPGDNLGITIVDHEIPEWSAAALERVIK